MTGFLITLILFLGISLFLIFNAYISNVQIITRGSGVAENVTMANNLKFALIVNILAFLMSIAYFFAKVI